MNETHKQLIALGTNILRASRNELYLSMRFLDLALSGLQYEMNLHFLHIGTDGEKILFHPRYLVQQYLSDRVLVNRAYLHMVLHCLFRHPFHLQKRQKELWDLACDIATESIVDRLEVGAVRLVVSDKRNETYDMLRQELQVLSAEGIYRVLKEKSLSAQEIEKLQLAFWVDDHVFWKQEEEPPEQEERTEEEKREEQQEQEKQQQLKQTWTQISEKTETNVETFAKDNGEEAGNILRYLKIENRQRYDYRRFLQKFVTQKEQIQIDEDAFDFIFYTYGLHLYGNLPLIEPLEYKEVKKVEELVIAIDTSQSCEGEAIKRFLEETYAIVSDTENFFHKVNIHIIQCDAEVQMDQKITSVEEWKYFMEHFTQKGMGGTDFRPLFRYVESLIEQKAFQNLKGLLYFTDGYGIFPKQRPAYDTAFLFYQEEPFDVAVPPWAMKLILQKEDLLDNEKTSQF